MAARCHGLPMTVTAVRCAMASWSAGNAARSRLPARHCWMPTVRSLETWVLTGSDMAGGAVTTGHVAVIGPNGDPGRAASLFLGNYHGKPLEVTTLQQGLAYYTGGAITSTTGCAVGTCNHRGFRCDTAADTSRPPGVGQRGATVVLYFYSTPNPVVWRLCDTAGLVFPNPTPVSTLDVFV